MPRGLASATAFTPGRRTPATFDETRPRGESAGVNSDRRMGAIGDLGYNARDLVGDPGGGEGYRAVYKPTVGWRGATEGTSAGGRARVH